MALILISVTDFSYDYFQGIVFNNKDEYPVEDTISEWLTSVMNEKIEPSSLYYQFIDKE